MATMEELRVRAYYIWEGHGCPDHSALDDWLEAERVAGRAADAPKEEAPMAAAALVARPAPKAPPRKRAAVQAVKASEPAPPAAAKKAASRSRKKAVTVPA